MMLAHSGMEVLESVWLLIVWLFAELYAVAVGLDAVYRVFRARSSRWQPLRLGIFPFLFGGASLIWFHTDWQFEGELWLFVLAALPAVSGLISILGSFARMDKLRIIIVASLLAIGGGCRSTDSTGIFAHGPWGDEQETKSFFARYKHILLVCIYEDHWEDKGPQGYSFHLFKATVVRSYKGDWRTSERVALVHGVDAPARTTSNADAGRLVVLFTNEHTNSEIGYDTGDVRTYDTELERVFQFVYPQWNSR